MIDSLTIYAEHKSNIRNLTQNNRKQFAYINYQERLQNPAMTPANTPKKEINIENENI